VTTRDTSKVVFGSGVNGGFELGFLVTDGTSVRVGFHVGVGSSVGAAVETVTDGGTGVPVDVALAGKYVAVAVNVFACAG
jgi:hypothetical protein